MYEYRKYVLTYYDMYEAVVRAILLVNYNYEQRSSCEKGYDIICLRDPYFPPLNYDRK